MNGLGNRAALRVPGAVTWTINAYRTKEQCRATRLYRSANVTYHAYRIAWPFPAPTSPAGAFIGSWECWTHT